MHIISIKNCLKPSKICININYTAEKYKIILYLYISIKMQKILQHF